jgi:hypothetical protein
MLLADCRQAFEDLQAHQLSSDRLVAYLKDLEGWNRGKGITPNALRNILKPFKIEPEERALIFSDWRHACIFPPINTATSKIEKRGYLRARFEDAWQRYLSPDRGEAQAAPQPEGDVLDPGPAHLLRPRRQVGPLSIVGM